MLGFYLRQIQVQKFVAVAGLNGKEDSVSFKSVSRPGHYMIAWGGNMLLEKNESTGLYRSIASFAVQNALDGGEATPSGL